MKRCFKTLFWIFLISLLIPASINAQVFPQSSWITKTPSEVGLKDDKLTEFANRVGGSGVVIKDGYLVKSWGNLTAQGEWASASKPLLSTLLFFAIEEGKVPGVDDLIKNWGWALRNDATEGNDTTMTFRHLANMVSGYKRGEGAGQAYAYNDYAISLYKKTVYVKVFNTSVSNASAVEALYTASNRLGPLQFQDGNLFTIKSGGPRVNMTPRDYARVGWFWLNRGNWNGTQLLPKSYFDNYMKPGVPGSLPVTSKSGTDYLQVGSDGGSDNQNTYGPGTYGFNWWFNGKKGTTNNYIWPDGPLDVIMAAGHNGLEVIVAIPSLNMVASARGNWGDMTAASGMNTSLKILKDSFSGSIPTLTLSPTSSPAFSPTPTLPTSPVPTGTGKPGDANNDNKVDGLDYVIWLNHYNQLAIGAANGDFNNSGKVDGLDYVIWLNNYNK